MVEMIVESVRVSASGVQRVVVLKAKEDDRYLLIWVGNPEAGAIALSMQNVAVARPMTHDLLRNVIEAMGGTVRQILVNDLVDNTYYARLIVDVDGRSQARIVPFTTQVLTAMVQGRTGATPYVRWGEWSILLILACALAGAGMAVRRAGARQ